MKMYEYLFHLGLGKYFYKTQKVKFVRGNLMDFNTQKLSCFYYFYCYYYYYY